MEKQCNSCNQLLDTVNFWKSGIYHHPTCKTCNKWISRYKKILQRCNNPTNVDYKYYGGRGIKCLITVDEIKILWDRDNASKMRMPSLDRENNDGDYIFHNCRFIEQGLNANKDKQWFIEKHKLYTEAYLSLGPIYN